MAPDQWNAVALDSQIRPSSSNPVVVNDYALAVWRSASGEINAWEDRCPHRGMRLSLGFVEGEQLRCIYHGWGYAPDGRCKVIPAHPALAPPATICAQRHAVESRYGLIWTNLAQEPQDVLPDLGRDDDWQPVRSIFVNAEIDKVRDAVASSGLGVAQGSGQWIVFDMADGSQLLAAFQRVSEGSTGVHFVLRGPAATDEGRHNLARQVTELRDRIQNI